MTTDGNREALRFLQKVESSRENIKIKYYTGRFFQIISLRNPAEWISPEEILYVNCLLFFILVCAGTRRFAVKKQKGDWPTKEVPARERRTRYSS